MEFSLGRTGELGVSRKGLINQALTLKSPFRKGGLRGIWIYGVD